MRATSLTIAILRSAYWRQFMYRVCSRGVSPPIDQEEAFVRDEAEHCHALPDSALAFIARAKASPSHLDLLLRAINLADDSL